MHGENMNTLETVWSQPVKCKKILNSNANTESTMHQTRHETLNKYE